MLTAFLSRIESRFPQLLLGAFYYAINAPVNSIIIFFLTLAFRLQGAGGVQLIRLNGHLDRQKLGTHSAGVDRFSSRRYTTKTTM